MTDRQEQPGTVATVTTAKMNDESLQDVIDIDEYILETRKKSSSTFGKRSSHKSQDTHTFSQGSQTPEQSLDGLEDYEPEEEKDDFKGGDSQDQNNYSDLLDDLLNLLHAENGEQECEQSVNTLITNNQKTNHLEKNELVDDLLDLLKQAQEEEDEVQDEERQSLLQISKENKALRACVQSLQEKMARLEEGLGMTAGSRRGAVIPSNRESRSVTFGSSVVSKQEEMDDDDSHSQNTPAVLGNHVDDSDAGSLMDESSKRMNQSANSQPASLLPSGTRRSKANQRKSRTARASTRGSAAGGLSNPLGALTNSLRSLVDHNGDDLLLQSLSEDTFGFLMAAPTASTSFALGMGVLLFQFALYLLMGGNLIDFEAGINESGGNLFGIPANVTSAVWLAQIVAIVIAVVMQDDIRTGIDMLREGYGEGMQAVFPNSSRTKFALSVFARLFAGALGLFVNFLLIVSSETVIDLLLNFTALAFVGQLDEVAFFLAKQGFSGRECLKQATMISEAEYPIPRRMVYFRKSIMMIFILIIMLIAWGAVRVNQVAGEYMCNTLVVQMGDEMRPELGTFSGLYDLQKPKGGRLFRSEHVMYVDRDAGHTRFAFCKNQGVWALQWKDNPNADFPEDPCDGWYARSSGTDTFDLTRSLEAGPWFVRDDMQREMQLEPFFLHCFECGNNFGAHQAEECTGRGTCSNALCDCDEGWYGMRCEFLAPCARLSMDARSTDDLLKESGSAGEVSAKKELAESAREGFEILVDDRPDSPSPPQMVNVYQRPVYVGHMLDGLYMISFFTGRRWVVTHSGLIPEINPATLFDKELGRDEVIRVFTNGFHAHWSLFAVQLVSEPMDIGTPQDQNSPVGLLMYEALSKTSKNDTEIQSPNLARPTDARAICAVCDEHNPCHYDGKCVDSVCQCAVGAKGAICEKSPVGNGRCDITYNIPYFQFDGG